MTESSDRRTLPVFVLRNSVLFPHQMLPLVAGRPSAMSAVEAALGTEDKALVVASPLEEDNEEPRFGDLFTFGTLAVIKKMARADGVIQFVVQGIERVKLLKATDEEAFIQAEVESVPRPEDWDTRIEALHREVLEEASKILSLVNPQAQAALTQMIEQVEAPLHQVYVLSSLLSLKLVDEQRLLSAATCPCWTINKCIRWRLPTTVLFDASVCRWI